VFKKDPSQSSVADGVGGHQEALAVVHSGGKGSIQGTGCGDKDKGKTWSGYFREGIDWALGMKGTRKAGFPTVSEFQLRETPEGGKCSI
jgi:hypothetical protein